MRKLIALSVVVLALLALVPAVGATATANIYAAHGIPGADIRALGLNVSDSLPVDIRVVGPGVDVCALRNFTFGSFAGPVPVPANTYEFRIGLADAANPCNPARVVVSSSFRLGGGENALIAAHLTVAGAPAIQKVTLFPERAAGSNNPRLDIVHLANAPIVDITATVVGQSAPALTLTNVSNRSFRFAGSRFSGVVPAASFDVRIFPAGSSTAVFGPARLNLMPGQNYIALAVGSLRNSSFTVLAFSIPLH